MNKIWIIAGLGTTAPEVEDLVPHRFQQLSNRLFEWEASVVGADGNSEGSMIHK